jgi:pimeloyl-ACP methyl ester carboxylesterase
MKWTVNREDNNGGRLMMGVGSTSRVIAADGVEIEVYVDGHEGGRPFVMLPSYGRGVEDFDDVAARVAAAGWEVLRPQPRGIGRSKGRMTGLTMSDLADDVSRVIRSLGGGRPAIVLGHAFGNMLSRVLAGDHPEAVTAVVLAAAQASQVAPEVVRAPFIAGDATAPTADRLAALREAFFASGHDATVWLDGWCPETLAMQRAAVNASPMASYWACGTVPMLEIIPTKDPFKPKRYWSELRDEFPDRVTTVVIDEAAHALFPEQSGKVGEALLGWLTRFHE